MSSPNVDHIVRLQEDADFLKIYQGAALSVVDGMPIVWASHWLGHPLKERVTGADLLPRLCEVAAQRSLSVYFLGALECGSTGSG
ncbi:MAG: WecB/TagA/CpsF family glycosyltransferase [Thiotrichaceae bacterium]